MKGVSARLLVLAGATASAAVGAELPARPPGWASPVAVEGAPNLHKVADGLYRSAQPTAEGFRRLRDLGIRTVVNLRSFHSDRDEIGDTGLAYEHIYMKAWHPEVKEAVRFLQIATDTNRMPVLVHCLHGADRTGAMCALYRIVVQGWTPAEALREMTDGGFGFHDIFSNLPAWVEAMDVDALRAAIGAGARQLPLIFNGRDLSGWQAPDPNPFWRAADGILIGENSADLKGHVLNTDRDYGDVEMELEVRWSGEIDSGIFLRRPPIQVQLGVSRSLKTDMTGSFYVRGYPEEGRAPDAQRLWRTGQWNRVRVEARGPAFAVWINGKRASAYTNSAHAEPGPIGLQIHAGLPMKVEFRNIHARPLDR